MVSPEVTHKHSQRGVRIVVKDVEFVRYRLMRQTCSFSDWLR